MENNKTNNMKITDGVSLAGLRLNSDGFTKEDKFDLGKQDNDRLVDFVENIETRPDFNDSSTFLYDGYEHIHVLYKDIATGRMGAATFSQIKDYKVVPNEENPRGIIMYFMDGTSERVLIRGEDKFDLDIGIQMCLFKKILSDAMCEDYGSSVMNKLVLHAKKVKKNNERFLVKTATEEAERKRVRTNLIAKKQRRSARRKQEQIEMMAEAYRKAMDSNPENDANE